MLTQHHLVCRQKQEELVHNSWMQMKTITSCSLCSVLWNRATTISPQVRQRFLKVMLSLDLSTCCKLVTSERFKLRLSWLTNLFWRRQWPSPQGTLHGRYQMYKFGCLIVSGLFFALITRHRSAISCCVSHSFVQSNCISPSKHSEWRRAWTKRMRNKNVVITTVSKFRLRGDWPASERYKPAARKNLRHIQFRVWSDQPTHPCRGALHHSFLAWTQHEFTPMPMKMSRPSLWFQKVSNWMENLPPPPLPLWSGLSFKGCWVERQ